MKKSSMDKSPVEMELQVMITWTMVTLCRAQGKIKWLHSVSLLIYVRILAETSWGCSERIQRDSQGRG